MSLVPMVIESEKGSERSWDIFSRLLKDRIVFVTGEIEDNMANLIVAQLLFLDSQDNEKDIHLYINSPGGSVTAGLAIIDTMNLLKSPISTVCVGLCASMGAMILSQGEKDKRFVLPNAEIMIHQPSGGARGQATDIEISAKNIGKMKTNLTKIMAEATGKEFKTVYQDMERDFYMNAVESVEYGIVDSILIKK